MATRGNNLIGIGDLARRTGVAVSALRFYEDKGLLEPLRTNGNQRRFLRSDIRRVSFILIAQRIGFTLEEIQAYMARLPHGRTPSVLDWQSLGRSMRAELDARIKLLTRTREKLDGCIGCGCLSLKTCKLYNPDDMAAEAGPGPRVLR